VVVSAVVAAVILATGLPVAGLISLHHQQAAASDQLASLRSENRALATQQQQLNSAAEIKRLARSRFQLVSPGQTLFEVLPPNQTATGTPSAAADPANQPLVAPSQAPDMTPDPGLPTAPTASASSTGTGGAAPSGSSAGPGSGPPSSFWGRVASTFEFWR
jgi:type II secretory pathway pseudopilin PulG